ncbi:MAG: hypothetical protein A4E29_00738 [Methanomassiliicoccales archaeon PtaB.Bin134]|nr:MAG: hypothetical protein A4E29_00738 [Methanomassiliicoccales archaeon PtaB.Bin134]
MRSDPLGVASIMAPGPPVGLLVGAHEHVPGLPRTQRGIGQHPAYRGVLYSEDRSPVHGVPVDPYRGVEVGLGLVEAPLHAQRPSRHPHVEGRCEHLVAWVPAPDAVRLRRLLGDSGDVAVHLPVAEQVVHTPVGGAQRYGVGHHDLGRPRRVGDVQLEVVPVEVEGVEQAELGARLQEPYGVAVLAPAGDPGGDPVEVFSKLVDRSLVRGQGVQPLIEDVVGGEVRPDDV